MGFLAVLARAPFFLRRINEIVEAIVEYRPDVLVIIDSPDFTHRIARRVRARLQDLPIVDYVCPQVWAWRPGRAKTMRAYIDVLLALLPFEPEALRRLGGPECVYVGHPMIEKIAELRPDPDETMARETGKPTIVVLPGSRRTEISRLLTVFGEAVEATVRETGPADFVLPAVEHLEAEIRAHVAKWAVQPRIVTGEAEKFAAFRRARAAIAASGTVTLELALAGVPLVVAYKVHPVEAFIFHRLVKVSTIVLANHVIGENVIPEFLQEDCVPEKIAKGLTTLIKGGEQRDAQVRAFRRLNSIMMLPEGDTPGTRAARLVLDASRKREQGKTRNLEPLRN
jgi:lipid-A-disaccharide synthase